MSKFWFTSDEHYGHCGIWKKCRRPGNEDDGDQFLIENHNSVVGPDDYVVHVGDFSTSGSRDFVLDIVGRLNGIHIFVKGNHDRISAHKTPMANIWCGEVGGMLIYAKHTPRVSKGRIMEIPTNSLLLHGHWHGRRVVVRPNIYDVGVDNNNYKPIGLNEILWRIHVTI